MQRPMRAAIVLLALIGLSVLPATAKAQTAPHDSSVTVTAGDAKQPHAEDDRAKSRKTSHARHQHHDHSSSDNTKLSKGGGLPRFNLEPLSLTLAPGTSDGAPKPPSSLNGRSSGTDLVGQVANAPDSFDGPPTSSNIESMGQGHNHTIVVPLFKLLGKLSDQPPPE
jgi:hypothetical protein